MHLQGNNCSREGASLDVICNLLANSGIHVVEGSPSPVDCRKRRLPGQERVVRKLKKEVSSRFCRGRLDFPVIVVVS